MFATLSNLLKSSMDKVREESSSDSPVRWPKDPQGLSADERKRLEELVILGTLLREVAKADGEFSAEEEKSVKAILSSRGGLKPEETALVFAAAAIGGLMLVVGPLLIVLPGLISMFSLLGVASGAVGAAGGIGAAALPFLGDPRPDGVLW